MATLVGSVIVTLMPAPKNRIRVIFISLLVALGTENFMLALTDSPTLWCIRQIAGWLPIPLMSGNLDVINRTTIPTEMQGRVYSYCNSLQFFTIPLGHLFAGWMVDEVCEPIMARVPDGGFMQTLFGSGKGSGTAMMMFILGIACVAVCLFFGRKLKKCGYIETT